MAITDYTVLSLADLEELNTVEDTDYILVNRGGNDYKVKTSLLKAYCADEFIGSIQTFLFTKIPSNYLLCDGSVYSTADYPKLYAKIGKTFNDSDDTDTTKFRVPDLRKYFLRNIDSDNTVGTKKVDTMRKIVGQFSSGSLSTTTDGTWKYSGAFNVKLIQGGMKDENNDALWKNANAMFDSSTGVEGQEGISSPNVGSETAPMHMYVVMAMKAS